MAGALVLIPGSRDHLSFLVKPVPTAMQASLGSLAHGAGRKWMRSDCKARLGGRIDGRDVSKGVLGSRIICNDRDLAYEEAGAAYKPIDTVIDMWVCQSPLRPQHRRKNWYLDVMLFAEPARDFGNEVRLETMRSSGPGGQHANKTETAVRATHLATRLSVKIGGSRSQSANKAAALALLGAKVREHVDNASDADKAQRRLRHCTRASQVVVKRFTGSDFRPKDWPRTPPSRPGSASAPFPDRARPSPG